MPSIIEDQDMPLAYCIIFILYIEIFLFMFNPKIKTQILVFAVLVTLILSFVILQNAINTNDDPIFVKYTYWAIGISSLVTCVGILLTAITENRHKTKPKYIHKVNPSTGYNISAEDDTLKTFEDNATKLSNDNNKTVKFIKTLFISNVIVTIIIAIRLHSYILIKFPLDRIQNTPSAAPTAYSFTTNLSNSLNNPKEFWDFIIKLMKQIINDYTTKLVFTNIVRVVFGVLLFILLLAPIIILFVYSLFNYLESKGGYVKIIFSPFTLFVQLCSYLVHKLKSLVSNKNVIILGVLHIFATSIYIISNSTRLFRLQIGD